MIDKRTNNPKIMTAKLFEENNILSSQTKSNMDSFLKIIYNMI